MTNLELHHYAALRRAIEHYDMEAASFLETDSPYDAMFPEADANAIREVDSYLRTMEAKNAAQREVIQAVHEDLLMRAEHDSNGIKVVNISHHVWSKVKAELLNPKESGGE